MKPASDNFLGENALTADNTLTATQTKPESELIGRPKSKSRRMRLLERMGYFGSLPSGIRITRATTLEDLRGAYQMVYDSFIQMGYILPNASKLRIRLFEAMPDTATFIAKANGKIIGVTSAVIDKPGIGIPADKAFHQELTDLRDEGYKVCEGTNWVIDPEYRKTNVMPELMRVCFAHSLMAGCNGMIAVVSPGHQSYYEILSFDTIGSIRSSSPNIDDPVIMQLNSYKKFFARWDAVQPEEQSDNAVVTNFFIGNNPYYDKVRRWNTLAESSFLDPLLLQHLFVNSSNFIYECTDKEREKISQSWGEDLFDEVLHRKQRKRLAS